MGQSEEKGMEETDEVVNQWMQKGLTAGGFGACLVCDAHPVTRQVSRVQVSLERHTTADQSNCLEKEESSTSWMPFSSCLQLQNRRKAKTKRVWCI
jgi:hypothetical protein